MSTSSLKGQIILEARGLKKHYFTSGGFFRERKAVRALDGVTLALHQKSTLAIVGESGCGKSTLAKLLLGLEPPTDGEVWIDGKNRTNVSPADARAFIQMIFQDPYNSLNPRMRAWRLIAEPLMINGMHSTSGIRVDCKTEAERLMLLVGLRPELGARFPHMFSGGQRQRIGIARALSLRPRVLVCDEPVSALDVSIQAQVLNLLLDLQDQFNLSYIFISHDLGVVEHISDEVAVMYLGKIVEHGPTREIFSNPKHPYTTALLASSPRVLGAGQDQKVQAGRIRGEPPSPFNPPSGCAFHERCPRAMDKCRTLAPELKAVGKAQVSCHLF